jgi:hypothetical protein
MSKIQNSIWIKNTNKTGQETMNLLKLLKDLGVFKEKPKKRKPKRKEEVFEDEEILQQPSGGGGGSDIGGGGGDIGGGNITSNLLALKGALSAKNTDEENIKKLKEATELQLGKLRDAQQDLTRTQQRPNFGFRTSAPRIETFDDITGKYIDINDPFPPKEGVVSEPAQEFNREGSSINIPDEVMDIDVTPKVSPEQGQFEDIEEEEEIIPVVKPKPEPKPEPKPKPKPKRISYEDIQNYVFDQYDLQPLYKEAKKQDIIDFYDNLVNTFGVDNQFEGMASKDIRVPILRQEIVDTIRQQYKILQG